MKNKRAKQMIVDVVLKGRAAYWYQDESEIYLANSLEDIEAYFGEPEEYPDDWGNFISADYRYFWQMQAGEINYQDGVKGKPYIRNGEETGWELLPLICSAYGEAHDVVQISTGCN